VPNYAKIWAFLRDHGFVFPLYFGLTLFFTFPTLLHLTDAIGGDHQADALQNYWNLWWTYEAVVKLHQNPFQASFIHYPFGLPLFFHTYNLLNGLISLPLQMVFGPTVAYNLMNYFAFTMAGVGAYCLAWHLTKQRSAAFLAGLIYAFSPYMAYHLKAGQPFMLSLEWFPFYLLALLKGLHERKRFLLLAALFLFMIALTDWHYTAYALLLTGLVGLHELGILPTWRERITLIKNLAFVGASFTLILSPILLPMFGEMAKEPYALRSLDHSIVHSTDLISFFLPSIFHPFWGEWASSIFYGHLTPKFVAGGVATLGSIPLILAIFGIFDSRSRSSLFILIFLVFFVLALGPYLQVNGQNSSETEHPIPLPYLLFRQLPLMSMHRIPSRFVSVVMLALAILASLGLHSLRQHLPKQYLSLFLFTSLLLLFEFWPRPFALTAVGKDQVSPFYQKIAQDGAQYAILEIPDLDSKSMFYQTYHQKPIFGGQIARPKGHPWRRARLFGPLLQVVPNFQDVGQKDDAEAVQMALRGQNVRYVVFYKQEFGNARKSAVEKLEKFLFVHSLPVYEDNVLRAYEILQEKIREPYWTLAPNEWYNLETTASPVPFRWAIGTKGSILVYSRGQKQARVQFDTFSFAQSRTLQIQSKGQLLGKTALPLGWKRRINFLFPLQPGENRIELTSLENANLVQDSGSQRRLSFNLANVSVGNP